MEEGPPMIVAWILAVVVGMGVALLASRKAVDQASTLAFGLKVRRSSSASIPSREETAGNI